MNNTVFRMIPSRAKLDTFLKSPAPAGPNVNSRRCNLRKSIRKIVRPCKGRTAFVPADPWVGTHGYSRLCHFVARTMPEHALRQIVGAVFFASLLAISAAAQTNEPALIIRGTVEKPLNLALADLQTMPRTKLTVREKDGADATFEGVVLVEVINRAKPIFSDKCCSNTINTVVIVSAADKYQAVFSWPELDPKFGPGKILLADQRNGQPLDPGHGPLEIIVPDEKVHARWVRQVKSIEVLPLGDRADTNSPPH
jgi:DMSO/TMAO reductase YedYZ molybdopterin-dependent catalytic subunit